MLYRGKRLKLRGIVLIFSSSKPRALGHSLKNSFPPNMKCWLNWFAMNLLFQIAYYALPSLLGIGVFVWVKRRPFVKFCLVVPAFFFVESFVLYWVYQWIPNLASPLLLEIKQSSIYAAYNLTWLIIFLLPLFLFGLISSVWHSLSGHKEHKNE